jgi:hypothetical protein
MKRKFTITTTLLTIILLLSQCSKPIVVQKQKPLPPGQAKKVAGKQSAKEFAPGQQKKANASSQKSVPPGQQKKATAGSEKPVPPGQAKKKQ